MSHSISTNLKITLLLATIACSWFVPATSSHAWQSATQPAATEKSPESEKMKGKKEDDDTPRPLQPWEIFVPDLESKDLAGSEKRAWEYRPYKVACWFCLDGSPRVNAIYPQAAQEIADRSELLDSSGWTLAIGQAPPRYRNLFLEFIGTPERCVGFTEQEVLNEYDKLMIVCLSDQASQIQATVREFDVQTQQWGPINRQSIPFGRSAGQQLMNAISQSFMPLAQIERITEIEVVVNGKKQKRDEVLMQLRAVRSCYTTELVEVAVLAEPEDGDDAQPSGEEENVEAAPMLKQFELSVIPASNSPAFIRKSDLFLPVIRRTDRSGNLTGLEPLEFTFLTVDKQQDSVVRASIQSTGRNPLGQRKSKKAKKLALVIRPPDSSTTLQLVSRDKEPIPMEGFTIKEVPVGAPRNVTGVPIGVSDFKGEFEVTPSDGGMRVLVISRGGRNLMKLPIVPGLYESVQTSLPNDEVRLYSQGVFKGFQTELLGLIIQREFVRSNLNGAFKKKLPEESKKFYDELRSLESLEEIRERLSNAVAELKSKTSDKRERAYVQGRFESLKALITKSIEKESKVRYDKDGKSYLERIQELKATARKKQ